MNNIKKNIYLSLLVSLGLGLSLLESSMPLPIMIPGAKLGLANIVILTAVVAFGFKESLFITILKSLLLMLLSGNVISMFYSLLAGIGSCLVMNLVYKQFSKKKYIFSSIGVSIFGAITHNIIQIGLAAIVLNNIKIFSYLPFLLLLSLVTGYFVGLASIFILRNLNLKIDKVDWEIK